MKNTLLTQTVPGTGVSRSILIALLGLIGSCSPGKAVDGGLDPELTSITVSPGTVALLPSGTQQFSVSGMMSDGSSGNVAVNWSATGGSVTSSGAYTAPAQEGTYSVVAVQQGGTMSDTATVTVDVPPPTLSAVILTPPSASLASGGTQQFSAVGQLSDGSNTTIPITWTATGGTVSASGLYTAGSSAGNFRVIARSANNLADTSSISISAPSITAIVLTPPSASLTSGQTQQFGVSAILSGGGTQPNPAVTWSATGGTISNGGLYTAGGTAGNFRVIATQQGGALADTSTVAVSVGTGGGSVLFQESFDDANQSARGWYDGSGAAGSITTADHAPGSTASLRLDFAQGATNPTGFSGRHLFTETDAVYLSYWVKYSSNWVGSGQNYHPHEFYFLTNEDGQYVGPAYNHLTVYVEQNYQNGGYAVLASQDAQNIDETRINQDLTSVTESRAVSGCNGNSDGTPGDCYQAGATHRNGKAWRSSQPVFMPNPGTGYKADWHHVEVYIKLNTISNGVGQLNGIAQYWFDGNLVIDKQNILLRTGAHSTMKFNQLLLGPYIGDGSPVAQTMWLDELVVRNAKP